jgi:hypothetical protein
MLEMHLLICCQYNKLKYASPKVIPVLTHLLNTIFERGDLPSQLKIGLVTPVHKKGKCPKNPDNYRRITVNSILGKILEKNMLTTTKAKLNPQQNPLQFGFTEKISSTHCALIITECIAEAKDNKDLLRVVFMDAKKAFDVVWHDAILTNLQQQGIKGNLWNLYNSMYTDSKACVKLGNSISAHFTEHQGIRQGGLTSADLFKARSNGILNRLSELPHSMKIGCIPVGAPTTADDMALLSTSRIGAQVQLKLAEADAKNLRYCYSGTKTRAQVIHAPSKHLEPPLTLSGHPLH